jgi:hypothetical protein
VLGYRQNASKVCGASLLDIECDEAIHSILDVMYARASYTAASGTLQFGNFNRRCSFITYMMFQTDRSNR